MIRYLGQRTIYALPIAMAVSFICFMLVHIAPGDPINAIVPPDAPADVVADVRRQYGLDQPILIQFGLWILRALQGDLGRSLATGRPVLADLSVAIGYSLRLAVCAASIGFLIGTILGATAAAHKNSWIDHAALALAAAGVSVPHYWLGMVLVIVFSVFLNALPALGAGAGAWAWDPEHVRHLVLPAATLSVIPMGIVTRTVRGTVGEILNQDFVATLRGKGLRRRSIAFHVLRNSAPPVLAVMGLQLGYLMGGSILVETVFSWPGTGMLLNNAIFQRDIPVLQGTILVLAMFFVTLNLVVDVAQTALDPRIGRA